MKIFLPPCKNPSLIKQFWSRLCFKKKELKTKAEKTTIQKNKKIDKIWQANNYKVKSQDILDKDPARNINQTENHKSKKKYEIQATYKCVH